MNLVFVCDDGKPCRRRDTCSDRCQFAAIRDQGEGGVTALLSRMRRDVVSGTRAEMRSSLKRAIAHIEQAQSEGGE